MRYRIEITKRADKQLLALSAKVRERIAEKIGLLGSDPSAQAIDVKPLINDPEARFRLRVGSYRVKFNRDDTLKVIAVARIGHRKEIYK